MGTRQYIGARYVPKFYDYNGSANWRPNTEYEALTIVTLNGNSYTSKIPVPSNVGSPDQNPDYWVATGVYNQQVEAYRQITMAVSERIEDVANDVENEATARENADNALSDAIANEVTARENADNALSDDIANEATTRENADNALSDDIANEATARENADNALSDDIANEATARENADSNMETVIENLFARSYKYRGTKIIGHAGAGSYQPNNTIISFNTAVSVMADGIECDVQMCSDHVPVCSHDPVVDSQILKEIPSTTATQIVVASATAIRDKQTIPLFSSFLNICKASSKIAFVELKWEAEHHMTIEDLPYVKGVIDQAMYDNVIMISWIAEPLIAYLQLDPHAKCIWLLSDPTPVSTDNIDLAKTYGFYGVGLPTNVDMSYVDYAHSVGMAVNIFTAPAYPTDMESWLAHNVDFVTTNSIMTCGDILPKLRKDFINAFGCNNGVPMPSKYACTLHQEGYPLPCSLVSRTDTTTGHIARMFGALASTRAACLPIKVQPGDKIIKRSVGGYSFSVTTWNTYLNTFIDDSGWLTGDTTYTIPASAEWAVITYRKNDTDTIDYNDLLLLYSMYGGIVRASS